MKRVIRVAKVEQNNGLEMTGPVVLVQVEQRNKTFSCGEKQTGERCL